MERKEDEDLDKAGFGGGGSASTSQDCQLRAKDDRGISLGAKTKEHLKKIQEHLSSFLKDKSAFATERKLQEHGFTECSSSRLASDHMSHNDRFSVPGSMKMENDFENTVHTKTCQTPEEESNRLHAGTSDGKDQQNGSQGNVSSDQLKTKGIPAPLPPEPSVHHSHRSGASHSPPEVPPRLPQALLESVKLSSKKIMQIYNHSNTDDTTHTHSRDTTEHKKWTSSDTALRAVYPEAPVELHFESTSQCSAFYTPSKSETKPHCETLLPGSERPGESSEPGDLAHVATIPTLQVHHIGSISEIQPGRVAATPPVDNRMDNDIAFKAGTPLLEILHATHRQGSVSDAALEDDTDMETLAYATNEVLSPEAKTMQINRPNFSDSPNARFDSIRILQEKKEVSTEPHLSPLPTVVRHLAVQKNCSTAESTIGEDKPFEMNIATQKEGSTVPSNCQDTTSPERPTQRAGVVHYSGPMRGYSVPAPPWREATRQPPPLPLPPNLLSPKSYLVEHPTSSYKYYCDTEPRPYMPTTEPITPKVSGLPLFSKAYQKVRNKRPFGVTSSSSEPKRGLVSGLGDLMTKVMWWRSPSGQGDMQRRFSALSASSASRDSSWSVDQTAASTSRSWRKATSRKPSEGKRPDPRLHTVADEEAAECLCEELYRPLLAQAACCCCWPVGLAAWILSATVLRGRQGTGETAVEKLAEQLTWLTLLLGLVFYFLLTVFMLFVIVLATGKT